jgi:hypothetical protein
MLRDSPVLVKRLRRRALKLAEDGTYQSQQLWYESHYPCHCTQYLATVTYRLDTFAAQETLN